MKPKKACPLGLCAPAMEHPLRKSSGLVQRDELNPWIQFFADFLIQEDSGNGTLIDKKVTPALHIKPRIHRFQRAGGRGEPAGEAGNREPRGWPGLGRSMAAWSGEECGAPSPAWMAPKLRY